VRTSCPCRSAGVSGLSRHPALRQIRRYGTAQNLATEYVHALVTAPANVFGTIVRQIEREITPFAVGADIKLLLEMIEAVFMAATPRQKQCR
jgi:hypothetical protein